jgi:hypothetical protein
LLVAARSELLEVACLASSADCRLPSSPAFSPLSLASSTTAGHCHLQVRRAKTPLARLPPAAPSPLHLSVSFPSLPPAPRRRMKHRSPSPPASTAGVAATRHAKCEASESLQVAHAVDNTVAVCCMHKQPIDVESACHHSAIIPTCLSSRADDAGVTEERARRGAEALPIGTAGRLSHCARRGEMRDTENRFIACTANSARVVACTLRGFDDMRQLAVFRPFLRVSFDCFVLTIQARCMQDKHANRHLLTLSVGWHGQTTSPSVAHEVSK